MNAVCSNADCPEQGVLKDATGLDPLPPVIRCGQCGRPCELKEADVGAAP